MIAIDTAAGLTSRVRRPGFSPFHRADRIAVLVLLALLWLGIVMGFGGEIARHIASHARPYPLIVHVHAAAFVGWLVLLTVQVLLIRAGQPALHRTLGWAGLGLAAAMVVLGPATAIVIHRSQFGTRDFDPSFLAVQGTDILGFAILTGAAFALRKQAAAHKRLMLLGVLYIADAGFSRWLAPGLHERLGDGYLGLLAQFYLGNGILILAMGAYDAITRRRLNPAYVAGVALIAALELGAPLLYVDPAWKVVATKLVGH